MQHKILNNDYENVFKNFKMNIHATFICLHLKLMGMKTTINVYHYANSEASLLKLIHVRDFLVENRKKININKQNMTQLLCLFKAFMVFSTVSIL